jgi:hypothetical protein
MSAQRTRMENQAAIVVKNHAIPSTQHRGQVRRGQISRKGTAVRIRVSTPLPRLGEMAGLAAVVDHEHRSPPPRHGSQRVLLNLARAFVILREAPR